MEFVFVPGICCAHLWAPYDDGHYHERCTTCGSKCKRENGKITEYSAGPGILDGARVYS